MINISLEQLTTEAGIQGFPIVGTIKPHYFTELKERLNQYIKEGYQFTFNNQDLEEKCNPFMIMKECKTIIVLGLPYFTRAVEDAGVDSKESSLKGRLARTAWGEDYHRVFHRKMENLGDSLKKLFPAITYQSYVDTGPLVDRYLAAEANLGFYGFNNLFYHPQYGSYVFYGYMLIDQEVEIPDNIKVHTKYQTPDLCKDCMQCMKVCPGGAIEKPYRVNPNRCISGILQMKGVMQDEDKVRIGNRIYGCDECQKVCPYNKELEYSSESAFIPTNPPAYPDLIELLSLSNKEFKNVYGNNASAWRGNRVLKRNALVALGNIKNPKAIPYILPFTKDSREDLQNAARWAMDRIKGKSKE